MTLLLGSWVEAAARTRYPAGTAPELGIGLLFSSLLVVSLRKKKKNLGKEEPGRMDHARKEVLILQLNLVST